MLVRQSLVTGMHVQFIGRGLLLWPLAATLAVSSPDSAGATAAELTAYPDRPIRMLVGFAPGGATDITARAIADQLGVAIGQHVVIDNRPGEAGNLATELAARATPDGHTVLMGTIAALAINPALYGDLRFDPLRDFSPITQAVSSTNVLVVRPGFQARTVKGLIQLAKTDPGRTRYGSTGAGSSGHLAGELFSSMAKVRMKHAPYKRESMALTDLLADQVQCVFATALSALPHIGLGKVLALGVTTRKRASILPEVPTIAEQGLPGFDANNWYGLLAPAGTPRAIVARLNAEIVRILHAPDVRHHLVALGLEPAPNRPEEFSAYLRSEVSKWSRVVRAASAEAI